MQYCFFLYQVSANLSWLYVYLKNYSILKKIKKTNKTQGLQMHKLLPHSQYRSVTLFLLLIFLPFLCFIGLLYLVSNEAQSNIFETDLLYLQQGVVPIPIATFRYSLNTCDKLKMQWIIVSVYKISVHAHFYPIQLWKNVLCFTVFPIIS